jgi:hypothetical protein
MPNSGKQTDAELRARTEVLLAEAVHVANQLRIQTERLAIAITHFQSSTESLQNDVNGASHDAD